ncbi:hypothetical protein [Silvibacterium sp.]|uniref:hypothetical protein n=1 Tax=Silvibacterium sp. TaxID=1964179 RepID=UPI0039E26647
MKAGDIVLVPVNGGILTEAQIIEMHGDIVRVSGFEELAVVRAKGRSPLGVGFPVRLIKVIEKANSN